MSIYYHHHHLLQNRGKTVWNANAPCSGLILKSVTKNAISRRRVTDSKHNVLKSVTYYPDPTIKWILFLKRRQHRKKHSTADCFVSSLKLFLYIFSSCSALNGKICIVHWKRIHNRRSVSKTHFNDRVLLDISHFLYDQLRHNTFYTHDWISWTLWANCNQNKIWNGNPFTFIAQCIWFVLHQLISRIKRKICMESQNFSINIQQ